MTNKRITVLNNLLSKIEKNIPFKSQKKLTISKSNIGWQLDHALKVINAVSNTLAKTDPKNYRKDFNIIRLLLFPLCYIPRGKGKAPKAALPPDIISTEDLLKQLQDAKTHVGNLNTLHKNTYFKHFIFGILPKAKTLRFLEMHTKHHLKIVNDILKK